MDRSPRVSVILPTFNRSGYLRQAVASVLAQTCPDFEIVVVDDGSADDTAAVVAGFNDPRIVYIRQENAGRSVARNRGMVAARGVYIAFLDDDDLYLPDKLALQAAYLDTHDDIGLVAGGAEIIAADGARVRTWETWMDQPELTLPGCLYACPLLTCAVLFRRRWLDALDHWFDPGMDRAEDTDFWLRLLVAGCRMAWAPAIVSAYRQHAGSSQHDDDRYYHSYLKLLDKLYAANDLPAALIAERPRLYAHYHVLGACRAYAAGQIEAGQERLLKAATIAPGTGESSPGGAQRGRTPPIIASLVGVAGGSDVADPDALINRVFDHLPPPLAHLKSHRRYALSARPMQRVFAAHAAHERPRLRDWLSGVGRYPRWLANRGVWSILVRDVVSHLAPQNRNRGRSEH